MDHAERLIQAKVSASIPGAISWKRLRFSLLKGEFELENSLLKGISVWATAREDLTLNLYDCRSDRIARTRFLVWGI